MIDILNSFIIMVLFLTRIPIPYRVDYSEEALEKGIKFLPFIGLIVGLILYGLTEVLSTVGLDRGAIVVLTCFAYVVITGGLHIDGLADTADGYLSNRDRGRVLEIMKDSQIGTFGVLGIVGVLGLSILSSYYVDNIYFLLYPIVGRSLALIACYRGSYARDSGMGKVFVERCKLSDVLIGVALLVLLVLYIDKWTGIITLVATVIITLTLLARISRIIGGITGDTIGFTIEISQMTYLLLTYLLNTLNGGF